MKKVIVKASCIEVEIIHNVMVQFNKGENEWYKYHEICDIWQREKTEHFNEPPTWKTISKDDKDGEFILETLKRIYEGRNDVYDGRGYDD